MNNYNDWARLVAKKIKAEGDLMAAIDKDGLSDEAARDAFVRAVLTSFLPESLGVGSGRIVDAHGNQSEHFDIVVYNKEFPRMSMQEASAVYLYESVLATFVVRSKFVRKTIFDALNICASLALLKTNLDKPVLLQLARKNGVRLGPNQAWEHDDALQSARFDLIARPPSFVFGFGGIKNSYRQLQENIELWISNRDNVDIATPMKSLPAVIATQGCFAWRNAAPLALSNRKMLGLGNDEAPVRLIVLQLLYLLNRRLRPRADSYGLKPNLGKYLSQFTPPKFELGIGSVESSVRVSTAEPAPAKSVSADKPTISARYKPALDHFSHQHGPEDADTAAGNPASHSTDAGESKSEPAEMSAQFTKTAPFAMAPTPSKEDSSNQDAESPTHSPFQPADLGSATIPDMIAPDIAAESESPPASASMAAPDTAAPQISSIIPPKPPVDIDLGAEEMSHDPQPSNGNSGTADERQDFSNTVVAPPDARALNQEQSRNSTKAFIARVKAQLSSSEPLTEKEKDPFSTTLPQ